MKTAFHVRVLRFSNILQIEGARTPADYSALLDAMDFGDQSGMSDADLRDMCIAALQDLKPVDAAYLVLKHDIGDALRDGQIRDAAGEMVDQKLWEEYADPAFHERMFNAGSLLYEAFPRVFPKPDAVSVTLEVTALNAAARALLAPSPDETFLVRLLSDGMDDRAVLNRLYGDQIRGKAFPNAEEVVWIVRTETDSEDVMTMEVIGSGYWLDGLEGTKSFDSAAYADEGRASP